MGSVAIITRGLAAIADDTHESSRTMHMRINRGVASRFLCNPVLIKVVSPKCLI
jgi:hypothetical protein